MACTTRCYPYYNTIVLGERLSVSDAQEFCIQLDSVSAESDVIVDGSQVVDIDTSVLQLLVALAVQVRNNGRRIKWVSPSHSLLNTAHLTGTTALLGL